MSKKDYIEANNNIEVNENLKIKTLNKMKSKNQKRVYNKVYPLASLAIMCAIVMAIVVPTKTRDNTIDTNDEYSEDITQLQTVGDFSNLHDMLKKRAKEENKNIFFTEDLSVKAETAVDQATNSMDSANSNSGSEQRKDFSETNTQVEGVDEADIVKTDGKYIYYLSRNTLTITETTDNNIIKAAKIEFEEKEGFTPREIFLKDNKIVIIGTEYREKKDESSNKNFISNTKTYTTAIIYNIEEKTKPVYERTVEVEGNYLSSRMIGNNIYLVANKYISAYLCKEHPISELNENDFKPKYIDTVIGEQEVCVDFDSIYCIPEFEDTSYLNILSFDISKKEPANIETYLGAGSQIYASNNNMYVTKVKSEYKRKIYEMKTEIYKFKLEDSKCTFVKTGTVPGSVLNQFSMDEKDGYFRIATTSNKTGSSEDNKNNLYVLNENLEIVGKIENLAPGEKIYSVRFMGNRAYMVTFVQTDPLFVIDLSDPTKPTVLGELKIPGYSKYLHPYDENHLIGIGEDTKIVNYGYGDIVTTDGMKMALFDVTDPTNPKEMYNEKIGKKGTSSEVLYNHKALLFSKEKNIIAFPISITKDNYEVEFQGAIVYGLSLEEGFELRGKIPNTAKPYDRFYRSNNVQRIIYIKDTIYTLSNNLIKAVDMNTMKEKGTLSI